MEYYSFLIGMLAVFCIFAIARMCTTFASCSEINYFSLWGLYFFLFCAVGVLLLCGGYDASSFLSSLDERCVLSGSLLVLYGGVAPIVIFYLLVVFFKRKDMIDPVFAAKKKDFGLLVINVIFVCSAIYYVISIHPSSLYMSLTGASMQEVALRRLDITRNYSQIGITQVASLAVVLSFICSYAAVFQGVRREVINFSSVFIVILSVFVLSSNGEKSTIVSYILGFLMVYKNARKETAKFNLHFLAAMALVILSSYLLFVKGDVIDSIKQAVERIAIAQQASVYLSLDYYHNIYGEIGFRSLTTVFHKIIGVSSQPAASEVLMAYYFPDVLEWGGWNINGLYIHEAWSNYGLVGIFFAPLVVASLNFFALVVLMQFRRFTLAPAVFYYMASSMPFYLTSFNSYLYSNYTFIVILLSIIYLVVNKISHGIIGCI